jgi:predicted AlkP superfamily phosphohydrolase/phosphomutase
VLSGQPTDGSVPFENVDWSRTKAYGLGLNGLYLNLQGREVNGVVPPEARAALADELVSKLGAARDPETGEALVSRVYRRGEIYSAGFDEVAPDLIVGYAKGVRSSDESSLGGVPAGIVSTNTDPWNGDHCMDPVVVPGILLTSRPLKRPAPSLQRLAGAILSEFGIDGFPFVEDH